MRLKDIKPGRWYQTARGVGRCLRAGGTHPPSVQLEIIHPFPQGRVYLAPRDVQHEVPAPESPRQEDNAEG
jgi:hypothetical protein